MKEEIADSINSLVRDAHEGVMEPDKAKQKAIKMIREFGEEKYQHGYDAGENDGYKTGFREGQSSMMKKGL